MPKIVRPSAAALVVVLLATVPAAPAGAVEPQPVSIATIMQRDFAGTPPEQPRFTDDGKAIVYERRRPATEIVDLWRIDLATGAATRIEDRERGQVDPADVVWSRDHRVKAFVRDGDLFYRDARGALHQVTRTHEQEGAPLVLLDGRIAFRRDDAFLAFDPATGTTATLADLRLADDPSVEKPKGFYEEQQLRYFEVLRGKRERSAAKKAESEARLRADPTRPPRPFWLGKGLALQAAELAPDGLHLAVVLGAERDLSEDEEQGADGGKPDKMAALVTESGYVEVLDVRPKVGTGKPASPKLALLDLAAGTRRDVDYAAVLPGLDEDPLAELRAGADAARAKAKAEAAAEDETAAPPATEPPGDAAPAQEEAKSEEAATDEAGPAKRVVSIDRLVWNDAGTALAVQLFSYDNKDRWLAAVAADGTGFRALERDHDPAWINWRFNDLGWLRDGGTIWYLSESSGYGHLWLRPLEGEKRALTSGAFEVDRPSLARDGGAFYVVANREHPGIEEVYRVDLAGGAMTRLTEHGGLVGGYAFSPDERRLLYLGSKVVQPEELYLRPLAPSRRGGPLAPAGPARRLTETVAAEFRAIDWAEPEIVEIPSRHGAGSIWARVYTPEEWSAERAWPAVAFVHGAGYLQNVHHGWSGYEREFRFHTLLVRRGYVVIDIDYRGSSGYGRDWRTAIYRNMGWPEVEDYEDGIEWLVENRAVDRARIGVYGGSYGGFFTFMAMFTKPDLFAAGAALRPVADWAHYNHGYTSNILNTPEVDPEAYRKSSPIEYAEGLRRPLLICHGMVDDNVVFQDTARLVERLIELGKTDWFETAFYPVESHAFKEPASWTDEYRRIWNLFEANLWK